METGRINHLLEKFFDKTASAEERFELWAYVEENENEWIIKRFLEKCLEKPLPERIPEKTAEEMLEAILSVPVRADKAAGTGKVRKVYTWRWVAAALFCLLAAGAAVFTIQQYRHAPVVKPITTAIMPGGNKAILTLADGTQVALDKSGNPVIQQGNTLVKNGKSGLVYEPATAGKEMVYNRLTTPRGGQYQLQLADGSKVWLNAASSIYYPAAFTGKDRTVEITGEAYFEIARNTKQPFYVKVHGGETVEVIGTAFNVNSYEDEKEIKTTLVTGAVKVDAANQAMVLQPGQQHRFNADKATAVVVSQVDIAQVIAWKNGAFSFNGTDLKGVMRQLSRWYNIDVSFQGSIPQGTFNGEIGMDLTLQEVLDGLATSKIKYKIVNKNNIIIYP